MVVGRFVNRVARTLGVEVRRVRSVKQYHERHHDVAYKVLESIEADGGECRRRDRRLCDEYAVDVLGNKDFAPWLYVYTAVRGEFKQGWIPDNYYALFVVPQRNGAYGALSEKQCISRRLLRCPELPDIGYLVNGRFVSTKHQIVEDKMVANLLFARHNRVVFKEDDSRRGRGVSVVKRDDFDSRAIKKMGDGVFQEFIMQHPFYHSLSPDAVATMRVTTVIDQFGKASVRSCYLRLGRSQDFHVKADTLIRVAIDRQTGVIDSVGYLPSWRMVSKHPDTGESFGKGIPPSFQECCDLAKRLHCDYPFVQCIGWDLAVSRTGEIKVLEWNGDHNDIKYSEAKQGPCFGDLNWGELWKEPHGDTE